MFDVGGRIVLQDNVSGALDALIGSSNRAEQALREVGQAGDASMKQAKTRIAELSREIEALKTKAKAGGGLTLVDVSRFREASGELRGLRGDLADLEGATKSTSSAMELFGKVSLVTGAAFGAMRIGSTIIELTKLGAQAQTMAQIFGNLSESMGVDGQALLGEMKRVSRGTVDEMTLMTAANRALLAGGADLADKVPQLFEIARAASLATGQDINYVFETLVKGINKASPLLIDNADIYIKIGTAVDEWAAKQGKVAEELSLTERRMAIANAVIEQGGAFMDRMGVSAETAADKVQSLGAASSDLKVALGQLLAEAGVVDMIAVLAKSMNEASRDLRTTDAIKELRDRLRELGDEDALERFDRQIEAIEKRGGGPGLFNLFSSEDDFQAWTDAGNRATLKAVEVYSKYANAVEILRNPLQALREGKIGVVSVTDAEVKGTEESTTALQAYAAALGQVASNTVSLSGLATQLGTLSGALDALASQVPAMPKIGPELFSANPTEIRAYVEELVQINPALAEAGARTLEFARDLEYNQKALIAATTSSDSSRIALLALAEATLGAGTSVLELTQNFDKLPPSVQAAINPVRLLAAAIADLQAQAAAPITVDVAVQGLSSTLDSIDSMALRLAGVLDPAKIKAFRDKARADATSHWQTMGAIDQFGMQLEQKTLLGGYEKIVADTLDSYKKIETGAKNMATNVAGSASELAGKIKAALNIGLDVTDLDFDMTAAGTYQPKALEAARQLAAVAARGFSEIEAHPDWASLLEIPPDVLAGSETALKAWAAQTQADVQDLARPDLINWDAFIENFKAQMDREAAQEMTIDIAVERLNAAGLLSGSDEERRKKVAEALGIAEPSITIDTLFQVGEEPSVARQNLLSQFLGDATALPVPVTPVWTTSTTTTEQGDVDAVGPKGPAALGAGSETLAGMYDAEVAKPDLEKQGQLSISYLTQGALSELENQPVALKVAAAWTTDFTENWQAFEAIGTSTGNVTFQAFYKAMEDNIGRVRRRMAEIILPEVVAMLAGSRSGSLP